MTKAPIKGLYNFIGALGMTTECLKLVFNVSYRNLRSMNLKSIFKNNNQVKLR